MDEYDERLDKVISDYLKDRSIKNDDLVSYLHVLQKLEALRDVPERDENVQSAGRQAFLEFARSMPVPVSKRPKRRPIGWKTFLKKERSPMSTIVSIVLALIVAFGGVGTTAYAAQDSLPTELLYPVKQFTEQIRLALTTDTEAEVHLLLDLTGERLNEMMSLVSMGEEVPEKTQERFQEQLQLALATAAQLGDPALMGALNRIQTMAQNQIQAMVQVQKNAPTDASSEALQLAIRAMNQVKNEAEGGLADPTTFRLHQGTNRPDNAPDQPEVGPQRQDDEVQPLSGDGGSGQGNGDGTGDGGGANGNGYGDGTGDGGDANGNGYGDGTGDGGDANGNGNGDGTQCDCKCECETCDCDCDCTPQGPANKPQGPNGGK